MHRWRRLAGQPSPRRANAGGGIQASSNRQDPCRQGSPLCPAPSRPCAAHSWADRDAAVLYAAPASPVSCTPGSSARAGSESARSTSVSANLVGAAHLRALGVDDQALPSLPAECVPQQEPRVQLSERRDRPPTHNWSALHVGAGPQGRATLGRAVQLALHGHCTAQLVSTSEWGPSCDERVVRTAANAATAAVVRD